MGKVLLGNVMGPEGPAGKDGVAGADGRAGIDGTDGKSAFELAADSGYTGTEEVFSESLASIEVIASSVNDGLLNLELWKQRTYTTSSSKKTYAYADSITRITSDRITIPSTMEITASDGYRFRYLTIPTTNGDFTYDVAKDWTNNYSASVSVSTDVVVSVKREDEGEITVGDLFDAISISPKKDNGFYTNALNDNTVYLNSKMIETNSALLELESKIDEKISELNPLENSNFIEPSIKPYIDKCIWTWWCRPNIATFTNSAAPGKKAFFGYVDDGGMVGVGEIECESGRVKRHELMFVGRDDHNAPAVLAHSNGRIYVFATDHDDNKEIYLYIGYNTYSGDYFYNPITITMPDVCTYSQVFDYTSDLGCLWLFSRVATNNWYLTKSDDAFGSTWGEAVPVVTGDRQYYIKFARVNGNGYIKMVMYSNPNISNYDTNIRMGFINLASGDILNADCATVLGNIADGTGVNFSNFDVIIAQPDGKRNRLLDVVEGSNANVSYIAYAQFTDETDVGYYIYYNGATIKVCDGGYTFYTASVYPGGVCFNQKDKNIIYVSRTNDSGVFVIEQYTYSSGAYGLTRTIAEGTKDHAYQKLIRPITDANGRVTIWQNGRFNDSNFSDYDMAAEYEHLGN